MWALSKTGSTEIYAEFKPFVNSSLSGLFFYQIRKLFSVATTLSYASGQGTLLEHKGVKITWLGHDGFKIENAGETLVIDPFKLAHDAHADYVLISHEHYDHCSADDLKRVVKPTSVVVATPACREEVSKTKPKEIKTVKPGDKVLLGSFEVRAIPAYNLNKFAKPGQVFHPRADGKVGYIVKTKGGVTIYHSGDSDLIPEMEGLKPDIALLPVSGIYVMTAEEAIQAADKIKPKIAVPMHYGTIVGSEKDAEKFKKEAKCEVHILTRE
ncbi:MAG: MBL fold metallo-hydrolase [Nitrososphaerota archaeon]|nr:MBL fold metallo-hydrolase [Nitrososphaerota archaeon]